MQEKRTIETEEEKKILSPKIDVVFQALFGEVGNERITKRFISSILKENITEIDLSQNTILRREKKESKLGVLDVIAKINGKENCNIEMQVTSRKDIIERMLFYWGKIYTRQINKGQEYKELEKTIVILIADFEIDKLKELSYHSQWKVIENKERKIVLTDKLELHILELPKIRGIKEGDELIDWLKFIEEPKSEGVREKMKENEELKEAVEKLESMSEDEYMQRIADLREKAILDENSLKGEGRREGRREAKLEVAKNMLKKKIPMETIIEITGLAEEEITED